MKILSYLCVLLPGLASSVSADDRTIYPAEGRDARSARLNRFAKATSP